MIGTAISADGLRLVQRIARTAGGAVAGEDGFARIQTLSRELVDWERMGFARYHPSSGTMELIADTARPPSAYAGPPTRV